MKRKLFALLVLAGGLFISSCQEDSFMEELDEDIELNHDMEGEGTDGDGDDDPPLAS